MKNAAKYSLVLVTAPDLKTARGLARATLKARLVACANLVPRVESHYWWLGKIETAAEVLIIFKTHKTKLLALEKLILQNHPYDTPEVLTLPVGRGNERYLQWLTASLSPPAKE
jgi:periplasmic divalent cation tolerance protein